ncbi:AAA family ATPase [Sphingomonas oligophenolica]|nr:AAA family ATPase [Sphingomonas oligophenolica]
MTAAQLNADIDLAKVMAAVARKLLGEPRQITHGGLEWRYGAHGSMQVHIGEGWYRDHECGEGGGTLALIQRERRCDQRGAFAWLEEQGLKPTGQRNQTARAIFYDYRDEDGAILFRVERRKPANPPFLPHGPDGRGGFHSRSGCMQGVRRVPYRLNDLIAAPKSSIIWITEGEKDADRLIAVGLVATTNAGGAGNFGAELAPYFEGRTVIALADNDAAGRKHVTVVRSRLSGVVRRFADLELPGLPVKGDVSDWLDAGGTVEELRDLGERALGQASEAEHADTTDDGPAVLPLEWFDTVEAQLTALWLVKNLFPQQGVVLIYGHSGSGKTFFVLDIALHVALGWAWAGRRVRQGLVIYLAAEGASGLRNRVAAFRRHHKITDHVPFAIIPTAIDLQAPNADVLRLAATIRSACKIAGADVAMIVIDTIAKTFGAGKENTDDMASYVSNAGWLSGEFQCCVIPVHHRPKDAESKEPRGHSSLKAGVDTVILIEDGQTKRAEVTKQKDGEIGKTVLFNLVPVELGVDEDGGIVTSCVVEPTETDLTPSMDPFLREVGRLSAGNRLAYDVLAELIENDGIAVPSDIPDPEINRNVVGKVAAFESWGDNYLLRAGTTRGQRGDKEYERARKAFDRARKTLDTKHIVRTWGGFSWITHELERSAGTNRGQNWGRSGDMGTAGTALYKERPVVPASPKSGVILASGDGVDDPVPGWEGL